MTFLTLNAREVNQDEWNRKAKDVINAHSRAIQVSGTTSARPTNNLTTGQTYYDETLNRPIWWTGSAWIKADGTVV